MIKCANPACTETNLKNFTVGKNGKREARCKACRAKARREWRKNNPKAQADIAYGTNFRYRHGTGLRRVVINPRRKSVTYMDEQSTIVRQYSGFKRLTSATLLVGFYKGQGYEIIQNTKAKIVLEKRVESTVAV